MNTGPTPISAGLASTPLSQQTMESRQNASQSTTAKSPASDAIHDTLETADREPEGGQTEARSQARKNNETGEHLDLMG